jgi:TonB family protein
MGSGYPRYTVMMTTDVRTALALVRRLALLCAALLLFSCAPFAQQPPCKSKGGAVKVAYPELARRMRIAGVVRIELRLTPSGGVRDSKVLGGNPLLVSAAQEAIKQAKFDGGDACIATFEFKNVRD